MPEKKPDKHPEQWLAMLIRLAARLPLPVLYLIADALFVLAFYLLGVQEVAPLHYSIFKGLWAGLMAAILVLPMVLCALRKPAAAQAA